MIYCGRHPLSTHGRNSNEKWFRVSVRVRVRVEGSALGVKHKTSVNIRCQGVTTPRLVEVNAAVTATTAVAA